MDKELKKQTEALVEEESGTKKQSSKLSVKKMILAGLLTILALVLIAVAVVLFSPGIQMKYMTNYVMKNLRDYNWTALQMEDPVRPGIEGAFGRQNVESVDLLYNYMKEGTSETTWEIKEIDKEKLTASVNVKYTDRSAFLEEYGNRMGDFIVAGLKSGTIGLNDMTNILSILSDEENKKLLDQSMEHTYEVSLGIPARQSTTMIVNFEKKGLICMPAGTSDEVNDVASAGLFQHLDEVVDVVAKRTIPQVIDHVFEAIQNFDEAEIKKYTGKDINEYLNMEADNQLYVILSDYLRACAGKMSYVVGDYDLETGKIEVTCKYLDSRNVLTNYVRQITLESLDLILGKKKKIDHASLLKKATENSTEEMITKVVTIHIDLENSDGFEISDEIYDVVSANLYTELGDYLKYLK